MNSEWPTKKQDIKTAEDIISKHLDLNDGQPLGLFEFMVDEPRSNEFKLSDWVVELSDFFDEKYGENGGKMITEKVLINCLLNGKTVH